jgi:hypothetical protein
MRILSIFGFVHFSWSFRFFEAFLKAGINEFETNNNLGGEGASDRQAPAAKSIYRSIF